MPVNVLPKKKYIMPVNADFTCFRNIIIQLTNNYRPITYKSSISCHIKSEFKSDHITINEIAIS